MSKKNVGLLQSEVTNISAKNIDFRFKVVFGASFGFGFIRGVFVSIFLPQTRKKVEVETFFSFFFSLVFSVRDGFDRFNLKLVKVVAAA